MYYYYDNITFIFINFLWIFFVNPDYIMAFGFYYTGGAQKTIIIPTKNVIKPIFSNNTIYYKPNSLASGGVGTVRNSHRKAKKT